MSDKFRRIRDLYAKEMFFPSWLGLFINPFYFARKNLAFHLKILGGEINGRILDVGCGSKPYMRLFQSTEYIGLEVDTEENRKSKKADVYYDGKRLPFNSDRFDSIISNQVLEHVFQPDDLLLEMGRVLKPGGKMLLTVPFVWDEHEQPYDFARYTSFGIRDLLERNGFRVIDQRKSTDNICVIFQLINCSIYKKFASSNGYINLLVTLLFMAPVNICGEFFMWITPGNSDLFLDNIVLAEKG